LFIIGGASPPPRDYDDSGGNGYDGNSCNGANDNADHLARI
jgi:hypothetical protein